ncbi:MAG: undecaprenyl-diphosphate phosphatase [Planctomycetota bacterium]|nr:MAG: undecaprenyl-diphosphate phosphatase [Planctomycetota bacterium]
MHWLEAVIFGIIQGATEFLPVSSSGHLAIAHRLGLSDLPESLEMTFDVLLHGASLIAIVIAFWPDILDAIKRGPRFWTLLAVGLVPTGLVGLMIRGVVEDFAKVILLIGIAYIYTTVLLATSQYLSRRREAAQGMIDDPASLRFRHAAIVGAMQITTLFPGVSRSGTTVAAGLFAGMTPRLAVSFSFLTGLPLIAAVTVKDGVRGGYGALLEAVGFAPLALSFVVCFVVSYVCIIALKLIVAKRLLHWFAAYCGGLAVLCITLGILGL